MPQPGYEGFSTLGDIVAGGPGDRAEKLYPQRLKQNFDAFGALEQARKRRSEAIAAGMMSDNRGKLTPDLVQRALAGDEAAKAELGAVTMGMAKGQPNLNTFTDGLGDIADQSIDQQRDAALKAGDTPQYNRLTALRTDKAYQPARVVGGNILPDGLTLGDEGFDVTPLPQTAATIVQRGAAADASGARADFIRRTPTKVPAGTVTVDRSQMPANVDPTAHDELAAIIIERKQQGLPPLSHEQLAAAAKARILGGDLSLSEAPELGGGSTGSADYADATLPRLDGSDPLIGKDKPSTLQQGRANADALRIKADALRAIADGAPKAAVAERLRKMGYPKIAGSL